MLSSFDKMKIFDTEGGIIEVRFLCLNSIRMIMKDRILLSHGIGVISENIEIKSNKAQVGDVITYEGQGTIELEAIAVDNCSNFYDYSIIKEEYYKIQTGNIII